jgi:hypothetical protein
MAGAANHWPKHWPVIVRADRYHHNALKILVVGAVGCEPVSIAKFPANREKNREFRGICPLDAILKTDKPVNSEACSDIPYSTEQGIFVKEQGIYWR